MIHDITCSFILVHSSIMLQSVLSPAPHFGARGDWEEKLNIKHLDL